MFPPDDLSSGLYAQSIIIYTPCIIVAFWVIEISSFYETYTYQELVWPWRCLMIRYCSSFLLGFECIFQLYSSGFSISKYGYRYHVTLCIGQLSVCYHWQIRDRNDLCTLYGSPQHKLIWALHSALRAWNCMDDKNRTGVVVGCEWGITNTRH